MGDQVVAPLTAPKTGAKHTLADVGNSFIAGNGVCQDGEQSAQCFLTDAERGRLYSGVEGRVSRVASMTSSAVGKLRVDELIKEAPDLDPITDLVIDAATGFLGKLASKAVKALRSAPTQSIVELAIATDSQDKVKEADESAIGIAIKSATSFTKKGVSKSVNSEAKDDFEADKEAATDFLSLLEKGVYDALETVVTQTFGMLGDADRIGLYKTLKDFSPPGVEAEISAALKRYRSSPASKIGRSKVSRHLEKPADGMSIPELLEHQQKEISNKKVDNVNDVRNLKLVQQEYDNGQPPRLYYYKRDFDGGLSDAPGGNALMNTEVEYPEYEAKDAKYVVYKEVEPEFMEIAIANNMKHWGRKFDVEKISAPDQMKQAANRKPEPEPEPFRPPHVPHYR